MATNPRVPGDLDRDRQQAERHDHARMHLVKERRSWLPWLALLAGIAILAVIVVTMPRAPKQTASPAGGLTPSQPAGAMLQVSQVQLSPIGPEGSVNVDGMVFNNGNNPVIGVTVEAVFRDTNNQVIDRVPTGMLGVEKSGGATKAFADEPLKPQETRQFRLQFHQVPQNWNHQAPEIRITNIAEAGQKNSGGAASTNRNQGQGGR